MSSEPLIVEKTVPKRTYWTRKKREQWAGWIFIAPEVFGLILLSVFPLLFSLFLSFTEWNLVGGLSAIHFIGLDNFVNLFKDNHFILALKNNVLFTVGTVPLTMLLGIVLSALIHKKLYGKAFFKVAFFIPYICSTVAIAAVWQALYHPSKGPLNQMLMEMGISSPPHWLVDTSYSLIAIMIIYIWQVLGYQMIIFLAGMTNIPEELYEAATIDGATGIQQFRRITVPLLGPTTFFLAITSTISSFKVFDMIKFLTNGGPNYSSTVIVYQIYEEGFERFKMGYASAMSWVLFLIIMLVTSITWITQSRKVHY
ncbi:carbohydrate ABC transporter permease [Paenibacillus riograndensis]|uniref:Binding-protein-dependent transport system inner membrane protein n=3 Tax=Paenibacillus riograndensis TaxID=483937 RepID=A0A0E4H8F9_9BACL|nr:sugar ABC transporter permease [Paenibacillus riograndensis]CQR53564.1 binding-protein-dependent transport system inner membrane protein [Paenibacillus riograndensis SBR5]